MASRTTYPNRYAADQRYGLAFRIENERVKTVIAGFCTFVRAPCPS